MNEAIAAYRNERAKVYADFVARAEADKADLLANPSDYCLQDAIGLVGVDEAVRMFLGGLLQDKP